MKGAVNIPFKSRFKRRKRLSLPPHSPFSSDNLNSRGALKIGGFLVGAEKKEMGTSCVGVKKLEI